MRNFHCSGKLVCRNSRMCRLTHMPNGQIPCWVESVPFGGQFLGTQSLARGKQQPVEELLPCSIPQYCLGLGLQPHEHQLESKSRISSKGVGGRLENCCQEPSKRSYLLKWILIFFSSLPVPVRAISKINSMKDGKQPKYPLLKNRLSIFILRKKIMNQ